MLRSRNPLCIPSAPEGPIGHKQEEGGWAGQRSHSEVLHSFRCNNRCRLEACMEEQSEQKDLVPLQQLPPGLMLHVCRDHEAS